MRYRFLLVLLLISTSIVQAQKLEKNAEGIYEYQEVVEVKSKPASEIYTKALEWIALNYESSNDVIQLTDPDQNLIIGKGVFLVTLFLKTGEIRHTLKIEARDGRFRVTFDRFSYYSSGSGEILFEDRMAGKKKIIQQTKDKIVESINSLKESILFTEEEDW